MAPTSIGAKDEAPALIEGAGISDASGADVAGPEARGGCRGNVWKVVARFWRSTSLPYWLSPELFSAALSLVSFSVGGNGGAPTTRAFLLPLAPVSIQGLLLASTTST
jgi:hypothetical protein